MPRPLAFWHLSWIPVAAAASLAACATGTMGDNVDTGGAGSGGAMPAGGTGGKPQGAQSGTGSGSPTATTTTGGGGMAKECPAGQFVQSVDASGALGCAPIDAAARDAVNAGCSVYFGQRDSCSGCAGLPTKWGSVNGNTCSPGVGAGNTCAEANLGGKTSTLFGLSLDGDVNQDDKLYLGFSCGVGSAETKPGPCDAGSFATGVSSGAVTCSPASGSVLAYVRERCSLYFGQNDSCAGCLEAPDRWGRVATAGCDAGGFVGNTCTMASLNNTNVQLLGLDLDGNVNDDDKFYLGVRCLPPEAATSTGKGSCPAGQLVAGIEADGSLRCVSPAPVIASYFAASCAFTFGTRDVCGACNLEPTKWGRVRDGACENGVGVNDSCTSSLLGLDAVQLFGLNTIGDVDENDKLYIGLRCD